MINSNIIDKSTNELLHNWFDYFSTDKPAAIYHLIVKKGQRDLIAFFKDNSSAPFAFGKASCINGSYASFCREYDNLQSFHSKEVPFFKGRTARPLFKIEFGGHAVIVLSHIPGRSVGALSENKAFQDDVNANKSLIDSVEKCWKEIGSIIDNNVLLTEEYIEEYFLRRRKCIQLSFTDNEHLLSEFNKLKTLFQKLCCGKTRLGPVHGDFWKDNLIFDGKNLFVIDWEKFNLSGFPIFDIYLFCFTYKSNGTFIDKCCQPIIELDETDKLIRTTLRNAALTLCLDNAQAALMFELFIFEMSVQGHLYYAKKVEPDDQWKLKLLHFIDSKETIFRECFDFNAQ